MRVLFDIVHPAHVHFYRPLHGTLVAEGHEVRVVARDKDVTHRLLEAAGISYTSIGTAGARSRLAQGRELVARVAALTRIGRAWRPDLILTRNPAGVQAARLCGAVGVFDTDDGRAAGVHFRAAAPFAHVITTPAAVGESYGSKHRTYEGYKALAYLHPDRFQPDVEGVRTDFDLAPGQPLVVLRFVSMTASHDHGESGMPAQLKAQLARRLASEARLVISSEAPLPPDLEALRQRIAPERIHHVLAAADLYVGDSQTMAAEAALLGTPSFRLSSWTGRLGYLEELGDRYGLVQSFTPAEGAQFTAAVEEALGHLEDWRERSRRGRHRLLQEKVDVTAWYRALLDEVAA